MSNNKYKFNNSALYNQLQNSFTFKDLPVFTEPIDGGVLPEVVVTTKAPEYINPITNTLYKLNVAQIKNNNSPLLKEFRRGQNIGAGIAITPILATGAAELAPFAISKGIEGATWIAKHPIRFTTDLLAGTAIDKAANDIKINGKSTVEHISDKTNLPEWAVNLGIGTIGGIGFEKGVMNPLFSRARAALYRNVIPIGYGNQSMRFSGLSKSDELKNTIKEFFSPKKLDTDLYPEWYYKTKSNWSIDRADKLDLLPGAEVDFRDAAYRKALNLKPRLDNDIYIDNLDGTVSYNLDLIDKQRFNQFNPKNLLIKSPRGFALKGEKPWVTGDWVTGNGGHINARWIDDNTVEIEDIWDVQPFQDFNRIPDLFVKMGNSNINISNLMHKYFPNFEVINTLGGTPFKLKQQFKISH